MTSKRTTACLSVYIPCTIMNIASPKSVPTHIWTKFLPQIFFAQYNNLSALSECFSKFTYTSINIKKDILSCNKSRVKKFELFRNRYGRELY